jgi:hypothetical protein
MSKPALTIEPEYRSKLEKDVAEKFAAAGVEYGYESKHIHYTVPAREAKYLPDFSHNDCPIIIEPKGRFGGNYEGFGGKRMVGSKDAAVKERQKFILLKEQHPELDIRFIFSRAATPIYPKSKTSYGKWATDHGFQWAEKVMPDAWVEEIKAYLKQSEKRK